MTSSAGAWRSPNWRWHVAWLALALALLISVGGALMLGAGLADPPRAGPLMWEDGHAQRWLLAPGQDQYRSVPIGLPPPPFTLEIAARFSADSPSAATWTLLLQQSALGVARQEQFIMYGYGYYAVNSQEALSGQIEFPHLRPVGEFNTLALDVAADGNATLRLNEEVAWHGRLSDVGPVGGWTFFIEGATPSTAQATLTWERLAIYAPRGS